MLVYFLLFLICFALFVYLLYGLSAGFLWLMSFRYLFFLLGQYRLYLAVMLLLLILRLLIGHLLPAPTLLVRRRFKCYPFGDSRTLIDLDLLFYYVAFLLFLGRMYIL